MSSQKSSKHSGTMPSLFSSSANMRSQSLPGSAQNATTSGPHVRRGSATIDALTRGLRKKSEMEITLEGKHEFIRTYSTFDSIKGQVELKFDKDTLIGDLTITFEGQSQTYVEKIAAASPTTGRTTGRHTFLRMQQPISADLLPENMLAKANTTYTIPFTFVVPDRLLPYICSHKVDHDEVKEAHLQLPPSIGDPMLSGEGNVLMDDLSPDMAKVGYSIKAKVGKVSPSTGRVLDVEEKITRIRIVPAREENPPLSLDDQDNHAYVLRKEKNVRKGAFKIGKKLGRLTAEVAQPKSLRLPAPQTKSRESVTTMAAVTLRFDPTTDQEQPPQMASLSAKLKVYTFFGAAAYNTIPQVAKYENWSTLHGLYPENISLSSRNIGSVQWTKHDPENRKKSTASSSASNSTELTRRASNFSTETSTTSSSSSSTSTSIPTASSAYDSSLPFFTAKVLVPVSLPTRPGDDVEASTNSSLPVLSRASKKTIFTPTFHTCIISRSYALELGLSFRAVNSQGNTTSAIGTSSITLMTPLQISQEGGSSPPPPEETQGSLFDLSLIEGTDEYDEAMARHLDHDLNFTNPFTAPSQQQAVHSVDFSRPEAIPEYEEVQTTFPDAAYAAAQHRHASIAVPPSATATSGSREQPPEYYTPFRARAESTAPVAGTGRRVSLRFRP